MNGGWIKLHRKILNSRVAQDNEEFAAWIKLLLMATHTELRFISKGDLIILKPGELITSERQLRTTWKVSRRKVRKFLEIWEKDGMIEVEKSPKGTRIKILKWQEYQAIPEISKGEPVFEPAFDLEPQGKAQKGEPVFEPQADLNKNVYKNVYNNIITPEKFKEIFPADKQHEILTLLHQLGFPKKTLRSRDDQFNLMRIWGHCEGDYTVLMATFKKIVQYRSQIFLFNNGFPGLKTIADKWDFLRTFEPEPDYDRLVKNINSKEAFFQTLESLSKAQQEKLVRILYKKGYRDAYTLFSEFKGNRERVSI